MTTSLIASAAIVPMLAISMPFAHMNANAELKAGKNANSGAFAAQLQVKEKCRDGQKALVMKKNADIKAYKASHELDSGTDIVAYVKWRQQLQKDFLKAKKQLKIECKNAQSSASSKSSLSSSKSSVSSPSSVSSSSRTSSSLSSSQTSTSSLVNSSSSVTSGSSLSSNSSLSSASSTSSAPVQASFNGNAWWKAFMGR